MRVLPSVGSFGPASPDEILRRVVGSSVVEIGDDDVSAGFR